MVSLASNETNCQYRNPVASVFKEFFLADSIQVYKPLKIKKEK